MNKLISEKPKRIDIVCVVAETEQAPALNSPPGVRNVEIGNHSHC